MKRRIGEKLGESQKSSLSNTREIGIQGLKSNLFNTNRTYGRCEDHLLRLALNEAEALAWQTGFPQLVFPLLAEEKVKSTVAWQKRQEAVMANVGEISLAA